MKMIDHIKALYASGDSQRLPLPAQAEDMELLQSMTPSHVTAARALMQGCISYTQGQPLFLEVSRSCGVVWVRLATVAEFKADISRTLAA
jgi:hypothetical protein